MCLYVKEGCDVEVTKKPIVVWKRVHTLNENSWQPVYQERHGSHPFGITLQAQKWSYSQAWGLTAEEHFTKSTPVLLDYLAIHEQIYPGKNRQAITERYVNEGFHAYTGYLWARHCGATKKELKPCIIPPKTEIVRGSNKEIVALKMIVCRDRKEMRKILKQYKKK